MEPVQRIALNSDMALSNKFSEMNDIPHSHEDHYLSEHNSALVVLNMTSTRTREILGLYVEAFHAMWDLHPPGSRKPPRDQPALMVALRTKRQIHQQEQAAPDSTQPFLRHADLPHSMFCRQRTTPEGQSMVCGADSSCIFAHKPDNVALR